MDLSLGLRFGSVNYLNAALAQWNSPITGKIIASGRLMASQELSA